jgi:hypothetical protein
LSRKIDTSTWRTYINEEYGFEFNYPSLFEPKEENTSDLVILAAENSGQLTVAVKNEKLYQ